jgi:hypothetical protein
VVDRRAQPAAGSPVVGRRGFLRTLGIGALAVAAPAVVVPERRIWSVGFGASRDVHGVESGTRLALMEQLAIERADVDRDAVDALRYQMGDSLAQKLRALQESGDYYRELLIMHGNPPPRTVAGRMQLVEDILREGLLESGSAKLSRTVERYADPWDLVPIQEQLEAVTRALLVGDPIEAQRILDEGAACERSRES